MNAVNPSAKRRLKNAWYSPSIFLILLSAINLVRFHDTQLDFPSLVLVSTLGARGIDSDRPVASDLMTASVDTKGLKLIGVAIFGGRSEALIQDGSGAPSSYGVGDSPRDGLRVEAITASYVSFKGVADRILIPRPSMVESMVKTGDMDGSVEPEVSLHGVQEELLGKAELNPNDRIVFVDGQPLSKFIANPDSLVSILAQPEVRVTVRRDGSLAVQMVKSELLTGVLKAFIARN